MSKKASTAMSKKASTTMSKKVGTPVVNKYDCPTCGLSIETVKTENVRCGVCKTSMIVRLKPRKENYVTGLGATASGRDTVDIDDQVAKYLRGVEPQDAIELVAEMLDTLDPKLAFTNKIKRHWTGFDGTTAEFLATRYEGKNDGMIRMNCGNILRGALKRTTEATA